MIKLKKQGGGYWIEFTRWIADYRDDRRTLLPMTKSEIVALYKLLKRKFDKIG